MTMADVWDTPRFRLVVLLGPAMSEGPEEGKGKGKGNGGEMGIDGYPVSLYAAKSQLAVSGTAGGNHAGKVGLLFRCAIWSQASGGQR